MLQQPTCAARQTLISQLILSLPCLTYRAFARLTAYFEDQLTLMQQEADSVRKKYNHDTEDFRQTQQLNHTRKEWDLNRPDGKQIDVPGRVGDGDERCGPSSMQRFDGEDLSVSTSADCIES